MTCYFCLQKAFEIVSHMICVSSEYDIYVCDIGLTSSRCGFIVDAAERCAKGNYNAYTYAKQTLGCREHDELAVVCEWPVMRAVVSIREHLEYTKPSRVESALSHFQENNRIMVFSERRPPLLLFGVVGSFSTF